MNIKKQLAYIAAGMLLLMVTFPSHAGSVYGKVGYHDHPWNIIVGYNDYGRSYDRGHRHGHKHKHYRHHRHHRHYHHHHKRHYKRHYDKYGDHYRRVKRCRY